MTGIGLAICAVAGILLGANPAASQLFETYEAAATPWIITQVKVEPGRIGDYLNGLRKGWAAQMEVGKRNGLVQDYQILVNFDDVDSGANVMLLARFADVQAMIPNKERDLKLRQEFAAMVGQVGEGQSVEEFNKYRTFMDSDTLWQVVYLDRPAEAASTTPDSAAPDPAAQDQAAPVPAVATDPQSPPPEAKVEKPGPDDPQR